MRKKISIPALLVAVLALAPITKVYGQCKTGDFSCIDQEFKEVCGDVIDKKGNPKYPPEIVPTQKVNHCVAAKQAKPVMIYNSVAAPLFITGAAICFAAFSRPSLSPVCSGTSTALSGADTFASGIFASKAEEMHKIMMANTGVSAGGTALGGLGLISGRNADFEKGVSRKSYVTEGGEAKKRMEAVKDLTKSANGKVESAERHVNSLERMGATPEKLKEAREELAQAKKFAAKAEKMSEKVNAQGEEATKLAKEAKRAGAMNLITGIMLTAQAAIKIAGATKAQQIRASSIEKAKKYPSENITPNTENLPDDFGAGGGGGGDGGRGRGGGDFSDGEFTEGEDNALAACEKALKGNSSALSGCGKGSDAAIAGLLDSGVAENFQQLTGQDVGQFISDFNGSGQSAAGTLGNMLGGNPEASAAIASVLSDVEKEGLNEGAAMYASLGGGDTSGGGGPDVGKMMGDALAKLFDPLAPKKDQTPGMKEAKFGADGRAPATGSELGDPKVSIFERVSTRYQTTRSRLAKLPWTSHYNRVSHR